MDIKNAEGRSLETEYGRVYIHKFLGKGKSGYSYLAEMDGRKIVLKLMHYEEVSCYSFGDSNKVDLEIRAYEELRSLGLSVPDLITFDRERNFLIKEFIDGPVATELIVENKLPESALEQLFKIQL